MYPLSTYDCLTECKKGIIGIYQRRKSINNAFF